jgi:hypothetical protein
MSEVNDYEDDEDIEPEDYCDYTGEICIGDPMFCEECPVMLEMF